MIRTILCLTRLKAADKEWQPLPYEQQLAMPEIEWPDYSVALTADGQRLLALEPKPRAITPLWQRRPEASWSRIARAQIREAMNEDDSWIGPPDDPN